MQHNRVGLFAVAILGLGLAACANTQTPPSASSSGPPQNVAGANTAPASAPVTGIAAESVLTVHGKIVSVDTANKLVTLQGPNGKNVTLTVNNPYNLNSIKSGDRFVAHFTEVISIIGRGPSSTPPVASLREGLWTAKPGGVPGAVAAAQVQVAVVVTQIDQDDQRISLQAPDGSTETVHVKNPEALKGLQLGDQIVITVTRSIAIALEREPNAS